MTKRRTVYAACLALALVMAGALPCRAAEAGDGEKIVSVTVEGNRRVDANQILAQMKLREGSTYSPAAANEDFKRIFDLHEFENVVLAPEPVEGGVRLVVKVTELPLLGTVEFAGAKHFKEKKLLELSGLRPGMPLDRQKLFQARTTIEDEYKKAGYYFAGVTLDQKSLEESGQAVFTITEGPRVRVRKIVFTGNDSLAAGELKKHISTQTRFWPLRSGTYSEDELDSDVEKLKTYYVSQGFLDVEVGRTVDFGPKQERAAITFVVREGMRYHIAAVAVKGSETIPPAYLLERLSLKTGSAYTADALKADREMITAEYGRIGYVHAYVDSKIEFTSEKGSLDVVYQVDEGPKIRVGEISITGNKITKDKVILRELGFIPEDVADSLQIKEAKRALEQTQLFSSVDISLIPTDDPGVENVLVHVQEKQTAQLILGAGVSSDAGLIGNVSVVQRNFDWSRWPRGKNDAGAFRGAGETLRLTLEPGTERQQYSLGYTQPYFLDLPVRMDASGAYYTRDRDTYTEERLGGQMSFGKSLMRHLYGSVGLRMENIDITDIEWYAPPDVFDVAGTSYLSSATVRLERDMTDNYFTPTTGSRTGVSVEQAGALGGDYTFTKIVLDGRRYWTVTEDVLGRRSVFSMRGRTGFAPGDPPIFERYYAGGQGSLRGFQYRGVGPFYGNQPLGGDFLLLGSAEYEFPLFGKSFRGVVFMDSGTVEEKTTISSLRASAGFGLRFTVDMMGAPVPFALDFGFPVAKEDQDETQVFSFSIAWSF